MAVRGGRTGENPQEFHEGRGVQVPYSHRDLVAEGLRPGLNLTPLFFAQRERLLAELKTRRQAT
jgi:hypothetical protein